MYFSVIKETGDYLALDLGDTALRVHLVRLHGSHFDAKYDTNSEKYDITEKLKSGTGTEVT